MADVTDLFLHAQALRAAGERGFVAEHDGVTDNLGKKEQHGMLQSMATRAALLSDPTPRLVFHSTPKQASWMNQREMWCSIVVRQLLKRASCTSVDD